MAMDVRKIEWSVRSGGVGEIISSEKYYKHFTALNACLTMSSD